MRFSSGNVGDSECRDATFDAISPDRAELFAWAVLLVAGMAISESDRAAVLPRVVADAGCRPQS